MNRIVFTELAEDDLIDIWVGIATDNEVAASRLVDEIHEVTRKLLTFPRMGRIADELRPGARAFVHASYLLVYRPMAYGIAVLRVVHGGRDLPWLEYPAAPEE
ncbi:MAG: type II toxin-antitoxin system RelE/ParE family toxin [Gammaproteobacteria bacterium]|nr:type II toxin-antitoxin system RelE/ParE family toxin [Gammaproteobacteria bacterium]